MTSKCRSTKTQLPTGFFLYSTSVPINIDNQDVVWFDFDITGYELRARIPDPAGTADVSHRVSITKSQVLNETTLSIADSTLDTEIKLGLLGSGLRTSTMP